MKEKSDVGEPVLRRRTIRALLRRGRSFLLATLLLLFPRVVSTQGQSLAIVFQNDTTRSIPLAGMQRNGVLYGSVNGIAGALSLGSAANPQEHSLDVQRPSLRVTFFADNPFVAITNLANTRTTMQLPGNVLSSLNNLYIPLAAFAPQFEKLFGISAVFEKSTKRLLLGKPLPPKPLFDIPSFVLQHKTNGMLIRISATRPLPDCESFLKDDGWLYVTIPGAKADIVTLKKIKPDGIIKKIVATQFRTSLQISFKLDGNYVSSEMAKDETSNDLLITIRTMQDETKDVIEEKRKPNARSGIVQRRKKYELDVIVLDAGHGGKDPGAIGVTRVKEKDVTLGIVLKLGVRIEKYLKGVKVVYTRKTDTFVELDRRGQIGNEKDGKLFISVHCNSMPKKPYPRRGFEVYLLRPGRTDEAIAIAERENSVIELEEGYEQRYKKLTDENFILVTMAQTAHMKASEMFAEFSTKEMSKVLEIPNNGVTQAGFLVLVGSAMPNVLVETAYLSNREDEKLLNSESGQEKYAEALFNAIKRYKAEYEKLLQEGNDL